MIRIKEDQEQLNLNDKTKQYDVFIGNHERVIGKKVYYKDRGVYIPCKVMGYSFKTREYELVTVDSPKRRFNTQKIYIPSDEIYYV